MWLSIVFCMFTRPGMPCHGTAPEGCLPAPIDEWVDDPSPGGTQKGGGLPLWLVYHWVYYTIYHPIIIQWFISVKKRMVYLWVYDFFMDLIRNSRGCFLGISMVYLSPMCSKYPLRRCLDPKKQLQILSQKVFGAVGKFGNYEFTISQQDLKWTTKKNCTLFHGTIMYKWICFFFIDKKNQINAGFEVNN